ncbi:MAG: oligosaccharide flippase family protein [Deltaproteobacteria bacterium]|nr:oligosaccharide flippase family protein [Deltaproteobacteria bacterium]MBW1979235.1 oligosaccharide flippase family protein [Deltaproteobacteria bacterium]MBW2301669.1 oligosaccharide flippase family protein [Deltaproteobacteria bacterium]
MRFVYAFLPLSWRPGKLARDTMILTTGLGLRALAQALVFLIVARVLGSQGYGAFSAALAIAGVWVHFCGLGGHVILMRDVAQDPASFPESWALTLAVLGVGTIPVLILYLASARWLLPGIPWILVASLGLGELVFWPFANAAACAYQGFERMGRSARLMLAPVLLRLVAAVLLLAAVFQRPGTDCLILWGGLYAGASLLGALYAHYRVRHDLGRPLWAGWRGLGAFVGAGLPFALIGGAHKLYVDADKFLLARLATLEVTGHYSAGYRLVDLAFLPLHGLLNAAVPRLFRAGAGGVVRTLRAVGPMFGPPVGYAAAAVGGIFVFAPLIPRLLGAEYAESALVVRWLLLLPLLSLPRLLLQRVLGVSNAQKLGMIAVMAGAMVNAGLNLWWIPLWSWRGAVVSTYAAELAMILILSGMIGSRIWKK